VAVKRKKAVAPRRRTPRKRLPRQPLLQSRVQHVDVSAVEVQELESIRVALQGLKARSSPPRWNADPDDVRRSVLKLVLTLVDLIRQLLERQAIRRMEAGTLNPDQTEAVGLALMRLEETIRDLAAQFNISPDDLNLDLGPIGRLI
jgi:hypothetical protein